MPAPGLEPGPDGLKVHDSASRALLARLEYLEPTVGLEPTRAFAIRL